MRSLGFAVSEGLYLFWPRSNSVSRIVSQKAGVWRRSSPHKSGPYIALLLIAWTVAVSLAGSAQAQVRRALIVGIDSYSEVTPLLKARNDAAAVHGMLVSAGFEADLMLDAGQIELLTGVNNFVSRISPGDEVVFFFAGHGVEIEGRNYLLPSDVPRAAPGTEILVTARSLALDTVIALIEGRGARASLLIVDACRDNPFPRQGTRSLGSSRGLARVAAAPEGTFIMFSAGQGQAALDRLSEDDPNPNSVFTRVLLPRLDEPGLAVHEMARLVRTEVRQIARSVGHEQFPAVYDQFDGSFMLVPAAQPVVPDPPLAAPQDTCIELLPLWQLLSQNDDIAALTAFASSYAERCSTLAALATSRLASLSDMQPRQPAAASEQVEPPEPPATAAVTEPPQTGGQTSDAEAGQTPDRTIAVPTSCLATDRDVSVLFSPFAGVSTFETFLERHPTCRHAFFARSALALRRSFVGRVPDERAGAAAERDILATSESRSVVQSQLRDLGFDPGPSDGVYGPATRRAISEFARFAAQTSYAFLTPGLLHHLRLMHQSAPATMDGRWTITTARARNAEIQRLQQIYLVIESGTIIRADMSQSSQLSPLTVHQLDIGEGGGFFFDITSHYMPVQSGRLRNENIRLTGTLDVNPRHLVRRTRTFDVGRYDGTWRAVILVDRMP
jgi:hypothetical protein